MKEFVIVVYGRMNPPTKGHEMVIQSAMRIKETGLPGTEVKQSKWKDKAWHENVSSKYFNNDTHIVFQPFDGSLKKAKVVVMVTESYVGKKISSENKKKTIVRNPLHPKNKVELIQSMVDKRSVEVVTVPSLYSIFTEYPEDEYNVIVVLGSDRVYGKERMSLISKASAVVSLGRPETSYSSTKLKQFIMSDNLKHARNMVSNKIPSTSFDKLVKKVIEGQRIHIKSKK